MKIWVILRYGKDNVIGPAFCAWSSSFNWSTGQAKLAQASGQFLAGKLFLKAGIGRG